MIAADGMDFRLQHFCGKQTIFVNICKKNVKKIGMG